MSDRSLFRIGENYRFFSVSQITADLQWWGSHQLVISLQLSPTINNQFVHELLAITRRYILRSTNRHFSLRVYVSLHTARYNRAHISKHILPQ